MNTWKDEVHFDDVIVSGDILEFIREQLQENLISYLSILEGVDLDDDKGSVLDDVCQIVVDTFKEVLV